MPRRLIGALITVMALSCIAVGANLVWPNTARSTDAQAFVPQADFDQTFASVAAIARRQYTTASLTQVDRDQVFTSMTAMLRRQYTSASMTKFEFDRTFASLITPSRHLNTPPNREKLRNAGWKRILGSS
jgi:hypothetical protein